MKFFKEKTPLQNGGRISSLPHRLFQIGQKYSWEEPMICKIRPTGYYDEFSRFHVIHQTEKGFLSYSYDTLRAVRKARGIENPDSQYITNHPYIGKSFIGRDGKKRTIKMVTRHFGFGDYFSATYEDDKGSGSVFTLLSEGTGIEKMYSTDSGFIEEQLK